MKHFLFVIALLVLCGWMPSQAEAYSFLMRPDQGYQHQMIYPEQMTEENRMLLRTYIRLGYCTRDMADANTNVLYECRQVVGDSTQPQMPPIIGLQNEVASKRRARSMMSLMEMVRETRKARAEALQNRGW